MRTVSAAAFMLIIAASMARADVLIVIDKSAQEVRVVADGDLAHVFKSSTGKYGTGTPNGSYGVERLHRYWYSRKYDYAPMPYSIFYDRGYAIHGTTVISRLGRPASHGCVRLHPKDAKVLFALVREQGKENTVVAVTGVNPKPKPSQLIAQKRKRKPARQARRVRDFDPGPFGWWGRL
jgi:lipoprotein-anchoring transpeptidase ErfK/SrfK